MERKIKLAYVGGGSKQWARVFMSDLALAQGLSGEIALHDIDQQAAQRNAAIGRRINGDPATVSVFDYQVYPRLEDALENADVVVISILPGTFQQMRSDVHAPEAYGIYQSVGDTVGPGGVLRAMRTVPIYEDFARKIRECCPGAWVLNLTNPMSLCVKTLYDVFPGIKAFGCCHEVFHAQTFLTKVLWQTRGIRAARNEIYTDASGINHFTWITEAKYGQTDLLALLPEFMERFYDQGYYEEGDDPFAFRYDPFAYGNKVKLDLFRRYGALAAAGDRHLAEFLPAAWYLRNPQTVRQWQFGLTTVDFREQQQAQRIAETIAYADGTRPFPVRKSSEEAADLIKALLGFDTRVTNVNLPNVGQMPQLPLGSIVETNCVFSNDQVRPVAAGKLPQAVAGLVYQNCANMDAAYEGIKRRDLTMIFAAFVNQPLCSGLSVEDAHRLFCQMCRNTREYLDPWFDLDGWISQPGPGSLGF